MNPQRNSKKNRRFNLVHSGTISAKFLEFLMTNSPFKRIFGNILIDGATRLVCQLGSLYLKIF